MDQPCTKLQMLLKWRILKDIYFLSKQGKGCIVTTIPCKEAADACVKDELAIKTDGGAYKITPLGETFYEKENAKQKRIEMESEIGELFRWR